MLVFTTSNSMIYFNRDSIEDLIKMKLFSGILSVLVVGISTSVSAQTINYT